MYLSHGILLNRRPPYNLLLECTGWCFVILIFLVTRMAISTSVCCNVEKKKEHLKNKGKMRKRRKQAQCRAALFFFSCPKGVACRLLTDTRTHTDRVTTVGTLSGFQDFILQPIINLSSRIGPKCGKEKKWGKYLTRKLVETNKGERWRTIEENLRKKEQKTEGNVRKSWGKLDWGNS